jgi:hypothetical protein
MVPKNNPSTLGAGGWKAAAGGTQSTEAPSIHRSDSIILQPGVLAMC